MVGDSPARSATAAANPATLRAHVLRPQEATLAMEAEAEVVAIILLLVAEARRLGLSLLCPSYIVLIRHTQLYLRWCRSSVARLRSGL